MGMVTGGQILFTEQVDQEAQGYHEGEGGDDVDDGIQAEMPGQHQDVNDHGKHRQSDSHALEHPLALPSGQRLDGRLYQGSKEPVLGEEDGRCETGMVVAQTDLTHHDRGEDSGHRIGELVDGEGCARLRASFLR